MKTVSNMIEASMTDLFKKHGAFWAFSNEQFTRNKDPKLSPGDYVRASVGYIVPKSNAKELRTEIDKLIKQAQGERLKRYGKVKVITHALYNYECIYTGEWLEAWENELSTYEGITQDDVYQVYLTEVKKSS